MLGTPSSGLQKGESKSSQCGTVLCASVPETHLEERRESGMKAVSFLFPPGTTIIAVLVGLELRYYDMIDCTAN